MDAVRWRRIERLFEDALARPEDERTVWLRAACGDDPALYRQVAALLDADAAPDAMLDGHALDALPDGEADRLFAADPDSTATRLRATVPRAEPERVGAWRLAEHVGTGGMGTVYRAERADGAFEQTVALKLVKRGMDTDAVLERFRAERRILARLEHPGIARLVDGGRAADGRPFLAMEYVEGEPITAYCARRRLGTDARLALVEQACEAVAFAHQNLVVHRDLKPSNILVAEEGAARGADGRGADARELPEPPAGTPAARVKLLDFGIAKVLADVDATLVTQTGQRTFTPAYAAPEQVRGGRVTTATDVYGLGAVLYRLLTDARPIRVEGRSPAEVELAILGEDPPRPSAAVRGDAHAAAARGTTPERLRRRLAGDLDRIVLKALRRDPAERYASAAELLADLRRHRAGLPVEARPDSGAYRLRKFAARHRAGVAAGAAAVLAVGAVTAVAFARVSAERDVARLEATKAAEVSDFLASLFASSDPRESGGADLTARQLLERGAGRIEADLAGQPEVQAQMLHVTGEVYRRMQLTDEAEPLLLRALALRRQREGPDAPATGATHDALGLVYELQGRYPEAAAAHGRALRVFRRHAEAHPLALANALHGLAFSQMRMGRLDSAEVHIREALAIKRALFPEDHAEVAYSLNILGDTHTFQRRYAEAEAVHREALRIRRAVLGPEHLDVSSSLHNLAASYRDSERFAEAEPLYREALAIQRTHYGDTNQEVANTLSQLAFVVGAQRRAEEALALHAQARDVMTRAVGAEHVRMTALLVARARTLERADRPAEADRAYAEAVALRRRLGGAPSAAMPAWIARRAAIAAGQGRPDRARDLLDEAAALCPALPDPAPCADGVAATRRTLDPG